MDINLEALKSEILEYLEHSDFAVFRSHAGGLEESKIIAWDSDRFPDYRQFLETATKSGQRMILFAARELAEEELTEAVEEMDELELERDQRRELEQHFKTAKRHIGETCALELAFSLDSHFYVYEARPDWYEEFLDAREEISAIFPPDAGIEDEGTEGLGGYYSNN